MTSVVELKDTYTTTSSTLLPNHNTYVFQYPFNPACASCANLIIIVPSFLYSY